MKEKPTIKGIFVQSHIEALREKQGDAAVKELEKLYGRPLAFRPLDNVPVREEVRIIELTLDLLSDVPVPEQQRAFEAGRLHFRNFATTPLGRIMFGTLPRDFKTLMLRAKYIAQHVFRNVTFTTVDMGPKSVKVTMGNNDYPLDHFRGLFYEWMHFFDLEGQVYAAITAPNQYEYTITWQ